MTLRWPLPALLAWLAAWLAWHTLPAPWDWPVAAAPVLLAAWQAAGLTRRAVIVGGWGLQALLLLGPDRLPAGVWLLILALLLLAYPISAWRDAPLFPTPPGALLPLNTRVALPRAAQVLDAGCGTGAGLRALRAAFPDARCVGIERSALLAFFARMRCPWAVIFHGDIWARPWADYTLVYLFQRPESMQRAWDKACAEMKDGTWLVSLEFQVEGQRPQASWPLAGGRRLWLYRIHRSSQRRKSPITREIG